MGEPVFHGRHEHGGAGAGEGDDQSETTASFSGASGGSSLCSSTSNLTDDATSSPAGHPSEAAPALQVDSGGPLYKLSPLVAQLPVRRGLSKFYQGKSQSFTSLCDATCVQDLAKKLPYNRRMKASKSFAAAAAAGHDTSLQRPSSNCAPWPCSKAIVKKTTKKKKPSRGTSFSCLLYSSSGRPPAYQSKSCAKLQMHLSEFMTE